MGLTSSANHSSERKSVDDMAMLHPFNGTPKNCRHFCPVPVTDRMPRKLSGSSNGGSPTPFLAPPSFENRSGVWKSKSIRSEIGSSSYFNGSFCGDEESRTIDENDSPRPSEEQIISSRRPSDSVDLTKEHYKLLCLTCEVIKRNAETIGHDGLKRMFNEMPEVASNFKASPNRPIRKGESWELMGQGIMYLYALDKCLQRANKPKAFRKHVAAIVKRHVAYGVTGDQMKKSLAIFQLLIEETVGGGKSNVSFNYDDVRKAWAKFFGLLQRAVDQASRS